MEESFQYIKLDYDIKKFYREREEEDKKNSKISFLQESFLSKNNSFDPHLNNILWKSEVIHVSSEISFQAFISSYDNNEPKLYIYRMKDTHSREIPYKKIILVHTSLKEFYTIISLLTDNISIFENLFYTYLKQEREKTDKYIKEEFSIPHDEDIIKDIEKSNTILEKIKK